MSNKVHIEIVVDKISVSFDFLFRMFDRILLTCKDRTKLDQTSKKLEAYLHSIQQESVQAKDNTTCCKDGACSPLCIRFNFRE